MIRNKLPNGWKEVELGSIGKILDGDWILSNDMSNDGKIGIVQLKHVGKGEFIEKKFQFITQEKFNELKCTEIKSGDLLVSRMADPICRSCLVPKLGFRTVTAVDVAIIRPKKEIANLKYLNFLLNTKYIQNQAFTYTTGTTRSRISRKNLEKLKIPLPPLETQKKIVSILEKAETLKQKRAEADKLTQEYLKSVFADMFLKETGKWEEIELGDQNLFYIQSGGTPLRIKKEYWEGGTIPWIGSTVCKDLPIHESEKFITEMGLKNSSARLLPKNTVLVALVGATIGKTGLLKFECSTNQNISGIEIKDKYRVNYIYLFFMIKNLYHRFLALSSESFKMANLSFVRSLKIPLPPIKLQKKFASIVEEVEKMKERQKESKEKINEMFNSLMQKAFNGELVR